jgi:hypothetical protein
MHIQRILTAKIKINDETPYYPKFLQLRLGKNQFEEEKNIIIREENMNLLHRIESALKKPSKYSRIFEPKECPSFNKQIIGFKRIKKEVENYQENIKFYNRIEKVKSFYDIDEIKKRNDGIKKNIKNLQKSIFEVQPSLLFLSPQSVKRGMKKINYISFNKSKSKRCNSCTNRCDSKNIFSEIKSVSRTNRQNRRRYDLSTDTNQFKSYQKINIDDKIKKILINPIRNKKIKNNKSNHNRNKSRKMEDNFNYIRKITSSYDNSSKLIKGKNQNKKEKTGLKRNKSEINLLN